jgi:hypothetical protein
MSTDVCKAFFLPTPRWRAITLSLSSADIGKAYSSEVLNINNTYSRNRYVKRTLWCTAQIVCSLLHKSYQPYQHTTIGLLSIGRISTPSTQIDWLESINYVVIICGRLWDGTSQLNCPLTLNVRTLYSVMYVPLRYRLSDVFITSSLVTKYCSQKHTFPFLHQWVFQTQQVYISLTTWQSGCIDDKNCFVIRKTSQTLWPMNRTSLLSG